MLLRLIGKEVLHNILSFRFAVTYALLFVLVLFAVFLMGNEHRQRMETYTRQEAEFRDRLDELAGVEDASEQLRQIRREDFTGVREPAPLAVLARGLEGSLPSRISSGGVFFVRTSEDRLGRNILLEIIQAPDFVYVVNMVLSLLALLFVFDSVCGEKERGTLKLLLANSVPRDTVLLGKWVGGYLSIAGPFAAAAAAGFLYLSLSGSLPLEQEVVSRFAAILVVSFLYISVCFSLGLLISTLAHRGATALLMALLVWIGWILVVPNVAPVVARLAAPVPSRQMIDAEQKAIDRETHLRAKAIRKSKGKVHGRDPEIDRIIQEANERKRKREDFYQDRMSRQTSLSQNLARLSPSASYLLAATRLAGTGPDLFTHFSDAVERFHGAHEDFRRMSRNVQDEDWFDPDDVPRLSVFSETLSEAFDAALFDILLLVVFNVLFFLLSYVFFLRYDVT